MSVAKVVELTASSKKSIEDAIENGLARAADTLTDIQGAWVQDIKVDVEDGKITAWRVNMKVTFVLK
ncbi:MAG TPA: dodecin domain-containing protein [Hyphomonadaceae bacterium]|nr:dodecin domain-containing protein [Hyphomonadaceae bacterium]